jgi:hypothetical protein
MLIRRLRPHSTPPEVQQISDEARTSFDRRSPPDQVVEQLDPDRIDERHGGKVKPQAAWQSA